MATQEQARTVKERHRDELLRRPGVSGIGTTVDGDEWYLVLHIDPAATGGTEWPEEIDGVPVRIRPSGPFMAQ